MKLGRWLLVCLGPSLVMLTCGDDDKPGGPNGSAGDESGGESGRDQGGSGGATGNRGGTSGASAGDGGMGGEAEGGSAGKGGSSGRGGTGTGGRSGMGGGAGTDGGAGGEGGAGCMTVEIPLSNGSFDESTSAWILYDEETGPERPIIVPASSEAIVADTPPNIAFFGGVIDCRAGMFQTIAIPDGARTLTLTGRRRITTAETAAAPFDVLTVQLWEDVQTTTVLVGDFDVLTNEDAAGTGWVDFGGTVDVESYAGQSLDLDFWAQTDYTLVTDFYVDSVRVTALVCF